MQGIEPAVDAQANILILIGILDHGRRWNEASLPAPHVRENRPSISIASQRLGRDKTGDCGIGQIPGHTATIGTPLGFGPRPPARTVGDERQ